MKNLQRLIPTAILASETHLLNNESKIPKEMNGYISSFGASIISAGLLPSVIFYSQKGESASERHKIILALQDILKQNYDLNIDLLAKVKDLYSSNIDQAEVNYLTDKINEAAIALKLAIRTFPKTS